MQDTQTLENHEVVSRATWLEARRALLAREKGLTRQRAELSAARRALPWVRVEDPYRFDTAGGTQTLAELFGGKSQLLVYHLMFGPEAEAACRSCSFWADDFNGITAHLAQRDVRMVAVSRGPLAKLQAFARRMAWSFPWVSSAGSRFNFDFGVSFTPEELSTGEIAYNYGKHRAHGSEMPGISVFARDAAGQVFHTYSCYSRGIDMMNGAYQYLDLVPKGRDEDGLPYPMAWLRHHDSYE